VARDLGLLINAPRQHCLRLMPALNVSGEEVALMLEMLDAVLGKVTQRSHDL
jgi:acetylornithine/N-succinyldiaminopimelate aminotransferase